MSNGAEATLHARFEYRELTRPRRIVYAQRFCDEDENTVRHPGLPSFPETMQTTVLFAAEGEQETRVTVITETCDDAGSQDIEAFTTERSGMTQGWTGSFDKLEALLTSS